MKLFIVTKSSELLLSHIVNTPADERIVIADNKLAEPFLNIGVQIVPIIPRGTTTAQRDKSFYDIAMPGLFGDAVFPSTELPIWKVLGIDRLRFWYYPHDDITKIMDMIVFDELVVSFDLQSPVIWQAVEHFGKCDAVKVNSIMDRQHLDFLKWYTNIRVLHVSHQYETQFLRKQKVRCKVIDAGLEPVARPRPAELREKTVGMYYDSRYDWKALTMFMDMNIGKKTLVIGFPNNREWRKFLTTFPNFANNPQVELQDAIGLMKCEEILLPTYDENIVRQIPENIRIVYYDIANTEKASLFNDISI